MKNRPEKIVKIILILWLVSFIIVSLGSYYNTVGINDIGNIISSLSEVFYKALFLPIIIFVGVKLVFRLGTKKAKYDVNREQLNDIDFTKYKDYYREILSVNSPLVLGYIDKLEIDINDIIAELLYLESKNIILIKDGKIDKNKNILEGELTYFEKAFLANIINGRLYLGNFELFCNYFKSELTKYSTENEKLIRLKKINYKKIIFLISILIFFSIIAECTTGTFGELLVSFGIIFLFAYASKYIYINIAGIYQRTDKGEEMNIRLEGLKNYLKDYTLLSERESKELELWDSYLVYSVMFGQNKKIIEEYKKYIVIDEMPE